MLAYGHVLTLGIMPGMTRVGVSPGSIGILPGQSLEHRLPPRLKGQPALRNFGFRMQCIPMFCAVLKVNVTVALA